MGDVILVIFDKFLIKHIVSKRNVMLAIHNFSELKSFANYAIISSSLKFLLKWYACQGQMNLEHCYSIMLYLWLSDCFNQSLQGSNWPYNLPFSLHARLNICHITIFHWIIEITLPMFLQECNILGCSWIVF